MSGTFPPRHARTEKSFDFLTVRFTNRPDAHNENHMLSPPIIKSPFEGFLLLGDYWESNPDRRFHKPQC